MEGSMAESCRVIQFRTSYPKIEEIIYRDSPSPFYRLEIPDAGNSGDFDADTRGSLVLKKPG